MTLQYVKTIESRLCSECGNPIPKPKRGPTGVTCSEACRQARSRRQRGVLTIRHVVRAWNEAAQTFLERVEREHSSGLIDSLTVSVEGTSLLDRWAAPGPRIDGHYVHHGFLDRDVQDLERLVRVFDTSEERRRIGEAVLAWIDAPNILPPGQVPSLAHYVNVVIRELKDEARA